jgi:hypothetical protein
MPLLALPKDRSVVLHQQTDGEDDCRFLRINQSRVCQLHKEALKQLYYVAAQWNRFDPRLLGTFWTPVYALVPTALAVFDLQALITVGKFLSRWCGQKLTSNNSKAWLSIARLVCWPDSSIASGVGSSNAKAAARARAR